MTRLEVIVTELLKQRWSMMGELAERVYKLPEKYQNEKEDFGTLPWVWVRAPHFFAAVVVGLDQKIVATAPILGRSRGQYIDSFIDECKRQGYEIGLL